MATSKSNSLPNGTNGEKASRPELPPNVSIFSPSNAHTTETLFSSTLFTRLTTTESTNPVHLRTALSKISVESGPSFFLQHHNAILIFDASSPSTDAQDTHHEHFRTMCLALKDADIGLTVSACIYDVESAVKAGFQLEKLSSGDVMVVDILSGDDGDDSDDEDDDEALLKGFVTTV